MEPIFKVGDKVKIVDRIYKQYDYKFNFTDDMLSLIGCVFTIKNVYKDFDKTEHFVEDDNALYILKESKFNWSSGMLMKANEYSLKSNENVTKTLKIKMKIENAVYSSLRKQGIKI